MNLDFENIDQLFDDSLENMELTPSARVKANIQKKMFWHNMLKNVYVKSSAVFLITGIVTCLILCNNSLEANLNNSQANEKHIPITSGDNVLLTSNVDSEMEFGNNDNQKQDSKIENQQIEDVKVLNTITATEEKNSANKLVDNQQTTSELIKQKSIEQSTNNYAYSNTRLENKKDGFVKTQNTIVVPNSSLTELNVPNNDRLAKVKEQISIPFLKNKESRLLSNIESPSLSNYPLIDDTVGVNILGQDIILPSNRWILGAYFRPNYSIATITSNGQENNQVSNINSEALKSQYSYGFGLELMYQFKQVFLGAGIAYTNYHQEFSVINNELTVEQHSDWNYFDVEHWDIASTSFLNLDSLLQGDTVLTVIVDSTLYLVQDSIQVESVDSVWNLNEVKANNSYQYFEIPLFVEYTFNRAKKWQPFIRLGLITGIYIKSKGYYLSADKQASNLESLPFAKINFWTHTGLGIKYNINKRLSAYALVDYRYNLNSIVSNQSYFKQNLNSVSLAFGVQYRFNKKSN